MSRPSLPAVVPAAGESRRMGRPKLTLSLGDGTTVLGRVLDALTGAGIEPIVVVGPPRTSRSWPEFSRIVEASSVHGLVCPETQTADMRESFERGLSSLDLEEADQPGVLLTPGDSIGLTRELVSCVVSEFLEHPSCLVIPVYSGRRGHPVVFPRDILKELSALPSGVGLNALRERHRDRVRLVEVEDPGTLDDLDTPEDLERWRTRTRLL